MFAFLKNRDEQYLYPSAANHIQPVRGSVIQGVFFYRKAEIPSCMADSQIFRFSAAAKYPLRLGAELFLADPGNILLHLHQGCYGSLIKGSIMTGIKCDFCIGIRGSQRL